MLLFCACWRACALDLTFLFTYVGLSDRSLFKTRPNIPHCAPAFIRCYSVSHTLSLFPPPFARSLSLSISLSLLSRYGALLEHIYGIYMEYIWNIYGIYMEYIWNIYVIYMEWYTGDMHYMGGSYDVTLHIWRSFYIYDVLFTYVGLSDMGWLRLGGSIKLQVSFAEYRPVIGLFCKRDL